MTPMQIYVTVERKNSVRPLTLYRLDRFIEFDTAKRFGITHVRFMANHKESNVFLMFFIMFSQCRQGLVRNNVPPNGGGHG